MAKRIKTNSTWAKRGFCMNNATPALVDPLKPQLVRADWKVEVMCGSAYTYENGTQWLIDTYCSGRPLVGLDTPHIQAAMQHPSYSGKWLILNEPDNDERPWEYMLPDEAAAMYMALWNIIKAGDPNAKCILPAGIYLNPAYAPNSYFEQMWAAIPKANQAGGKTYRADVVGLHTHYYDYFPNGGRFTLNDYCRGMKEWRNVRFTDRVMQLYLTEVGYHPNAPQDPTKNMLKPAEIQAKCNKHDWAGWCWQPQTPSGRPEQHLINNDATLTAEGQAFVALAN